MCIRDSFIALSDVCDRDTAMLIKREVSDGVIAPGYTEEALEILKQKKKGNYNVIQIDANYRPAPIEHKQVFGVTFEQGPVSYTHLSGKIQRCRKGSRRIRLHSRGRLGNRRNRKKCGYKPERLRTGQHIHAGRRAEPVQQLLSGSKEELYLQPEV